MLLRACRARSLRLPGIVAHLKTTLPIFQSRNFAEATIATIHQEPPPPAQSHSESEPLPPAEGTRVVRVRSHFPPPESAQSSPTAQEPYKVARTHVRGLPVYQERKSGGNLKLTTVKKIQGDAEALRKQLAETLQPTPKRIEINGRTNHVVIKGWYRDQIQSFLEAKGF